MKVRHERTDRLRAGTALRRLVAVAAMMAATVAVALGLAAPSLGGVARAATRAGMPPAGGAPSSPAPPAVLWTAPATIDVDPLSALSCPTASICVAVDRNGRVLVSSDPAESARGWSSPQDIDGDLTLSGVSCPTPSLCAAIDASGDVLTSTDPSARPATWTVSHVDDSPRVPNTDGQTGPLLRAISCPSASLCVAVDTAGNALVSSDPAGGPTAWSLVHADTNLSPACARVHTSCQAPLVGLACPSASLCVAVDLTGNILQSTDPTAAAPWRSHPALSGIGSLWGVSCPTTSLCATVDGPGSQLITWNPAELAQLHRRRLPYGLYGVWCAPYALCMSGASTSGGLSELAGSLHAQQPRSPWTLSPVGAVTAVACPSRLLCVAVDGDGGVSEGVPTPTLESLLRSQVLAPRLVSATRLLLRHGGYRVSFTSPIAIMLSVTWEQIPGRVRGRRGQPAPVIIARGSLRFVNPQTEPVAVRLTLAGRRLLRSATGPVAVRALVSASTPTGVVTTSRRLMLRALPRRSRSRRGGARPRRSRSRALPRRSVARRTRRTVR
jgi:hypothetical protein